MVTASVSGLSTAATDGSMPAIDIIVATMSMGPALIGDEMDDYVDLTLGTCSITLPFIGDNDFSFRHGYTLSSLCSLEIRSIDYHPTLKNGCDTLRIIYAGVCAYSANPAALYPRRLTKVHQLLPTVHGNSQKPTEMFSAKNDWHRGK